MEFKIGEDFVEEKNEDNNKKKDNGVLKLIIIVVLAILAFLLVFLVLNSIFNPKTKTTTTNTQVETSEKRSLTESNVKILYGYVTYNASSAIRYDIFVKNKKVTLNTFTEEEKYYYALQYVQVEDFSYTGKLDENNNKIYTISDRKIKKYMEYFFGKDVTYSKDLTIKYPFSFSINDKNVGIMKYNKDTASFDTIFIKEDTREEYVIAPYMGKLVEAYKEKDGGYRLVEKLIYLVAKKQENGKYELTVSKDYEHKNIIESSSDLTEEDLRNISIDKYINKAATITYNFKIKEPSNVLYFYSSEIK
jgi:flagellar basal body-associated protein FliL